MICGLQCFPACVPREQLPSDSNEARHMFHILLPEVEHDETRQPDELSGLTQTTKTTLSLSMVERMEG